jgi:glycosyltransferase involved in cell wall biosynthesis
MKTAILIPCYNEALTISKVVADFRKVLPDSVIYVYDNNSTDGTAEIALQSGAVVCREIMQGKGNVIRKMFADIEADIYILIDGDGTYHVPSVCLMIDLLKRNNYDMVVGHRKETMATAYRFGHRFGNKTLTALVRFIFGSLIQDMLSGYRVMTRRFVKTFPAHSSGFEIETELTVYALEMRLGVAEIESPYDSRPTGSSSKLRTYRDGFLILTTIINLVRDQKPFFFFTLLAFMLFLISVILAVPIFNEYLLTGLVPRLPTALLSVGLSLSGTVAFFAGIILDSVSRGRREAKRLNFLSIAR